MAGAVRCESFIPSHNPKDLLRPILHQLLIRTLRTARKPRFHLCHRHHAGSPGTSPSPSTALPGRATCPSIRTVLTPRHRAPLLRRARLPGPWRLHVDARSHSSKRSVVLLLVEDYRRVSLLAVRAGTGSRNCIRLSIRGNGALVRIDHLACLLTCGVNRVVIDPLD
jgi:hypothetical protein